MPGSPPSTASMSARSRRWGIFANDVNPVARSNVCPEVHKPDGPSFHAFSLAVPAPNAPASFVIAGSGESQEGPGEYRGPHRAPMARPPPTRWATRSPRDDGDGTADWEAVGATWADTTATQIYTVYDIHPHFAKDIVARGGARHGADWHYCRPPVHRPGLRDGLPRRACGTCARDVSERRISCSSIAAQAGRIPVMNTPTITSAIKTPTRAVSDQPP